MANIAPHSPDDGSVDRNAIVDHCYQFFYILLDYNPLFTFQVILSNVNNFQIFFGDFYILYLKKTLKKRIHSYFRKISKTTYSQIY